MKKYQLGLYEKSMPNTLTLKEKLQAAKDAGFDYMEISVDETPEKLSRLDWTMDEILDLKTDMDAVGLPIYSMCLSGHRKYPMGSLDPAIEVHSLEIMEKAVTLAAHLGIRIIQMAGYDVYYETGNEETRKRFIKNLYVATQMAALHGIILGFETMETPFMDTVGKAMAFVEEINSPYLGVYPDIGNLTNASKIYGHTVNEDLKKGKGHIFATHLKETIPGHYREIPFGEGHTDYITQLQLLKNLNVRLFVGEFWYLGEENWMDNLKSANSFLRERLDTVY
jgi:L-ribulose-5-phosphate 3-epimerase